MRLIDRIAVCVALLGLAGGVCASAPVVSNVTASQRTDGSKKVDIYYNVSDSDSATLDISVMVSSDGGSNYTISASSMSGDVGSNVPRGTGKHIVWSAGTDLPGAYGTSYKVSVIASDSAFSGEMIWIAAGSFLMGNNGSEPYSYSEELPQHSVSLSGYYIGKYEVTRGQYRQFMNAGGYTNSVYWSTAGWSWKGSRTEPDYWAASQDWGTGTFTQTDNHPVVGVTYYEAEAFCNWAGGHLPTEAQWERAARWTGSHANVYPWGDVWGVEKCNNYNDSNSAGGGYAKRQTAPVGSYPSYASPSGCQDMAGNVYEWCQDWYKSYPGNSRPIDYTNILRATRGSGWSNYYGQDNNNRCAYRSDSLPPDLSWNGSGFRLVR